MLSTSLEVLSDCGRRCPRWVRSPVRTVRWSVFAAQADRHRHDQAGKEEFMAEENLQRFELTGTFVGAPRCWCDRGGALDRRKARIDDGQWKWVASARGQNMYRGQVYV